MNECQIHPGYSVPGWSISTPAKANFQPDGTLPCPIPGCIQKFNDHHGSRYTFEQWKNHVTSKDMHHYLWYDAALCFQPRALKNTYIRIDKRYNIAVCHFRREPIHPKKLQDHCRRCRGCRYINIEFLNDAEMKNVGHISENVLLRDRKAVQGFEACEAYYCCNKIYGPSQQGIHAHLKNNNRNHNLSPPVKCMRYRTSRHGYAYIPISDGEYKKLSSLSDTVVVASLFDKMSDTEDYGSLKELVLSHGYNLFTTYYEQFAKLCLEQLNNVTWNLHPKLAKEWSLVRDDLNNKMENYWFLVDERNNYPNNGILWSEIVNKTSLLSSVPLFIKQVCSDVDMQIHREAIERYLQVCDELTLQLMILLYTLLPIPPDLDEFCGLRYTNTKTTMRNIFVSNGVLKIRQSSYSISLPYVFGELVVRFLVIVRPMQIQLAKKMEFSPDFIARLSTHLFYSDYEKFEKEMMSTTRVFIKTSINLKNWRRLLQEMRQTAMKNESFTDQMFANGWMNSTRLNSIKMFDQASSFLS